MVVLVELLLLSLMQRRLSLQLLIHVVRKALCLDFAAVAVEVVAVVHHYLRWKSAVGRHCRAHAYHSSVI